MLLQDRVFFRGAAGTLFFAVPCSKLWHMDIKANAIWDRSTRIPEIYGTLIFFGLLTYFFIAYIFNFVHITEFRILNVAILITGVYYALKQYRRTHRGHMDYFHAFTVGMATVAIGTLTFAAFLLLYLHIDKHLMRLLREQQAIEVHLNPYIISFTASLEGVFSGMFVTFLLANFLATRTPVLHERPTSEVIQ